jgi:thioredoxin 1
MTQPTQSQESGSFGPWLLIIGLLLGAGVLVLMTWDGLSSRRPAGQGGMVVAVTEDSWQTDVLESDIPVVVDFSATWCGPCQEFAPILERIAERYQGKVKVASLDVGDHSFDKAQKLATQYKISGIPHIMIFKRGRIHQQFRGFTPERDLAAAIDGALR